jgi:6,7-dimethyl-8-ribityllumazine synthase
MSRADTIREDASGLRIALLVSRYHEEITTPLDQGARDAFRAAGGDESLLEVFDCPGAFELAGLAGVAVATGRFHAVVCLGCVVRGETTHDAWINGAVAGELAAISARQGVPVAFGLLTVNDLDQARARSGGAKGNKGEESMLAAIAAARLAARIREGAKS